VTVGLRLAGVRSRAHTERRGVILPDLIAGGIVVAVSVLLSQPLFRAHDLSTGAGDWAAQAFRVRDLLDHGITSWSHTWAGGMPLWEGYQALPHLTTAALVWLFGLEVTRAMVLLTGVMLIVLRSAVYVAARVLGAPPLAALTGALAVCALDTVHQPVANYSELWGLALTPLVLAGAFRWSGRPGGLIVAAFAGLAVELHPLLAVIGVVGLAAGYATGQSPRRFVIAIGQVTLFLAGAAVFWLPVILSARPAYTEPYFLSTEFARLLLTLAVAGFLPVWPWIALLCAAGAVAVLARGGERAALCFLLLVGGCIAALIGISLLEQTPDSLRAGQLTRLIGLTPVLTGLFVAVLSGVLIRHRVASTYALAAACTVLVAVALARSGTPGPRAAGIDPVIAMLGRVDPGGGRILADPVITAEASFSAPPDLRFAGSYSGREWSILHGPLQFFLAGHGDGERLASYLVAHGVEYLLVPAGSRPEIIDRRSGEPAAWEQVDSTSGFDLLRTPWPVPLAWVTSRDERNGLTVPNERFRDVPSAYVRDTITRELAGRALAADAVRAEVTYPSGTSLVITTSGLDGSRYLVVNENWDRTWRATVDGKPLPVERFGANQIGVDLQGVTGEATIDLRHGWPRQARIGLWLTLAAIPVALVLAGWMHRRRV
jgi:hypothetical protein